MSGALSSDLTIGFRSLYRSEYELNQRQDQILSIVFSALAFEWEITRLHNKWMHIESLESGEFLSTEILEESLKKYRSIYDKIKITGKLLHPDGFEKYAKHDHEFRETIDKKFPSLNLDSLIKDFEKNIFWPRNNILHNGNTNYNKDDALKAYNISYLGLVILNSMDKYRRNI